MPKYKAESIVKIYACKAVTKISIKNIKTTATIEAGATKYDLNINIREIKLIIIICPAVMLAKSRIINEKGLVNIPINSIGAKKSFIGTGTPGAQKICFQ